MSRCAQLFLATTTIGEHFRDALDIPMFDIRYEDFREAPDQYAEAIANSLGETWEATNHLPAASPIDQWLRYKSDLAPWTKDLAQMATAQGYPAK